MDRPSYVQIAKERFGNPATIDSERRKAASPAFQLNRQHAGVLAAVVAGLVRRDSAGHPVIKEPRPRAMPQRCDRSVNPMLACGWAVEDEHGVFAATSAGLDALAAYRSQR